MGTWEVFLMTIIATFFASYAGAKVGGKIAEQAAVEGVREAAKFKKQEREKQREDAESQIGLLILQEFEIAKTLMEIMLEALFKEAKKTPAKC